MATDEKNYGTMLDFEEMRGLVTTVCIVLIALISLATGIYLNFWFGIVALLVSSYFFFQNSYVVFSDNPPTYWMPEVRGKLVNEAQPWGPVFLPMRTSLTIGYVAVSGEVMHADVEVTEVIPGDSTTVLIRAHLVFSIDPHNPVKLISMGGFEKVSRRLVEKTGQVLRQWILDPKGGPEKMNDVKLTFDRVRGMDDEANNELLQGLARTEITEIPPDVPVEAIIGTLKNRDLSDREKRDMEAFSQRTPAEQERIKDLVKQRLADVIAAKNGERTFAVDFLGLVLRTVYIDKIGPDEKTAIEIAKVAAATYNARAKKIDAEAMRDRAETLKPVTRDMDPLRAAFIQDGLVKEDVQVHRYEASSELIGPAKDLLSQFVEAVAGRLAGGKGVPNGTIIGNTSSASSAASPSTTPDAGGTNPPAGK